ncbi:MAG: hypothetical protein RMM58_12670 [Chloroflexota bacterium]|nr:hypothetical protein [Dehalococcoidia bacterium]MDW8254722.1 hypothetical protein [Chloroflexota bacterium]
MVVETVPRHASRRVRSQPADLLLDPTATAGESEQFPRPTRPAGWPEIKLGLWWLGVAGFVAIFSGLFWALAWPEPRGIAALRIQFEFAVPLTLAWVGGLASLLTGIVGVLRQRSRAPARRRAHRPLPRAA